MALTATRHQQGAQQTAEATNTFTADPMVKIAADLATRLGLIPTDETILNTSGHDGPVTPQIPTRPMRRPPKGARRRRRRRPRHLLWTAI
jgi:hypothetical protein